MLLIGIGNGRLERVVTGPGAVELAVQNGHRVRHGGKDRGLVKGGIVVTHDAQVVIGAVQPPSGAAVARTGVIKTVGDLLDANITSLVVVSIAGGQERLIQPQRKCGQAHIIFQIGIDGRVFVDERSRRAMFFGYVQAGEEKVIIIALHHLRDVVDVIVGRATSRHIAGVGAVAGNVGQHLRHPGQPHRMGRRPRTVG